MDWFSSKNIYFISKIISGFVDFLVYVFFMLLMMLVILQYGAYRHNGEIVEGFWEALGIAIVQFIVALGLRYCVRFILKEIEELSGCLENVKTKEVEDNG